MTTALKRFIEAIVAWTPRARGVAPGGLGRRLRRALGEAALAASVRADDLGGAVARSLILAPHAAHRVVVPVAGQIVRIRIVRAEIELRTAAGGADTHRADERANSQEPLHTSDDGQYRVCVSSRCA